MRKIIPANDNWLFTKAGTAEVVTLPHTWNAVDGQDGGNDYYRGTCTYTKTFAKPAAARTRRSGWNSWGRPTPVM